MGASTGIFGRSEVAVMVAVVLLTTLITALTLRSAFNLKTEEESAGSMPESLLVFVTSAEAQVETREDLLQATSFRTRPNNRAILLTLAESESITE
jgi:hypothetical protein